MDKITKAHEFSKNAHEGQVRKFSRLPYFTHPNGVVKILKKYLNTVPEELIISAYLHDVVEDTETTHEDIVEEFGTEVAGIVRQLTMDKKVRKGFPTKADYMEYHVRLMEPSSLTVKLVDRIHNLMYLSLDGVDKDFAVRYLDESRRILNVAEKKLKNLIGYNAENIGILSKILSAVIITLSIQYKCDLSGLTDE